MRQTRQRHAVLTALQHSDRHPTALDLLDSVRLGLPNISLGTVYRVLHSLEQEGCIRSFATAFGGRRYDADVHAHHHIVCLGCGELMDVPDLVEANARGEVERWTGYTVDAVELQWKGVCPRCRNSAVPDEGIMTAMSANGTDPTSL